MDKKFIVLSGFFFVLFGLFISLMLFEKPLVRFTRAKQERPSAEKSILFAWPLRVPADGKSESTINVFIRNDNGDELGKRTVTLTAAIGEFEESTVVADKLGKAEFKIKSSVAGIAEIRGVVENSTPIVQTVSIEFAPL